MLSESVVKRLILSRYTYELASDQIHTGRDLSAFVAINLLQDSVELFLLSLAEHLNVQIEKRTEFLQYFTKINQKIAPASLPLSVPFVQLNKMRVASKHDGIKPDTEELRRFLTLTRAFFEQVSSDQLNVDFWTVSLLDELEDSEKKSLLCEAQQALKDGYYDICLVRCRMAFFLEFETSFSIHQFGSDDAPHIGALAAFLGCRAPYYAQNKEYILQRVAEPFDYIVLDHAVIDSDLLKDGIDPVAFWNVWRLTPQVFRYKDGDWAEKNDLGKLDPDGIIERAVYVFDHTVDLLLRKQRRRRMLKWTSRQTNWVINLKDYKVPVYQKADKSSTILGYLPEDLQQVSVDSSIPGLKKDGTYWHINYSPGILGAEFLMGYVYEDDINF